MVKHTQAIRRQKLTHCLSVFDHFVGLALKGLRGLSPQKKSIFVKNFNFRNCFYSFVSNSSTLFNINPFITSYFVSPIFDPILSEK